LCLAYLAYLPFWVEFLWIWESSRPQPSQASKPQPQPASPSPAGAGHPASAQDDAGYGVATLGTLEGGFLKVCLVDPIPAGIQ